VLLEPLDFLVLCRGVCFGLCHQREGGDDENRDKSDTAPQVDRTAQGPNPDSPGDHKCSGDEEGLGRLEETIRAIDESRQKPRRTLH
jgi:hypothetical protein